MSSIDPARLAAVRIDADTVRRVMFGGTTLVACLAIGVPMALAYAGVLPDAALVVGVPALVVTMLVDTFLYNWLDIEAGSAIWVMIAVFVYLEAVAIAIVVRGLRAWYLAGTDRSAPEHRR